MLAGIGASRRTGWRRACIPLLVLASGAVVRRRLSRLIARPRPPAAAWLTEPEGFSLPSKHTTIAALTAGACVEAAGTSGRWYAAAALAAAAVGASRVYLGVHWPGDVIAGWMFAAGWLQLTGPG
jgi:undecaprenyl-diphosphatase